MVTTISTQKTFPDVPTILRRLPTILKSMSMKVLGKKLFVRIVEFMAWMLCMFDRHYYN